MELPKVGDKWRFLGPNGEQDDYWVTYIDAKVTHLTHAETGEEFPAYETQNFLPDDFDSQWVKIGRAEEAFCGSCEEQLKAEGDYLCEECRFGKGELE